MASFVSRPYPKSSLTKATTFSQLVISFLVSVYFSASLSSPPGPLIAYAAPSTDFSAAASAFRASSSHSFRCSALIPEGTP